MEDLAWLAGHRFLSVTRREYNWVVAFDRNVSVVAHCLWRFLVDGHIRFTSDDDGHQFGLPAPIDAAREVSDRLADKIIKSVELRDGTLDLRLHFDSGYILEILPDSSGYEAWDVTNAVDRYIAIGGGELSLLRGYQKGLPGDAGSE